MLTIHTKECRIIYEKKLSLKNKELFIINNFFESFFLCLTKIIEGFKKNFRHKKIFDQSKFLLKILDQSKFNKLW